MKFIYKRRYIKRIVFGTLITALLVFAVIFIIVPVIYRYSYVFQRNLLFLNFVSVPVDFKKPESVGLQGANNFYVNTHDNVTIGAWHILPSGLLLSSHSKSKKEWEQWLKHGEPIFLYMHGNSGNRGTTHRVELYKVLQESNFHVITFDYRSYGDSSPDPPTEMGVVNDSRTLYNWIKARAGNAKIFFWGHSLGTGVSSHLVDILESEQEKVSGLILESPFNNMADEVRSYPLARYFRYLPWFDYFFTQPMYENGFRFESDVHLTKVDTPIMILHAEDDIVVPLHLGQKLYEAVKQARSDSGSHSPLIMKIFPCKEKFGHKYIYKAAALPVYVRDFVNQSISFETS